MDTQLKLRLRVIFLATTTAVLTVTACDYPYEPVGKDEVGIGTGSPGGGPPSTPIPALVPIEGTWRRIVVRQDEFGFVNSEETTWTFEPDGDALQVLVVANASLGVADTTVNIGRWAMDSVTLVVDFTQPPQGRVIMAAAVGPGGQTLFLGGQEYLRVE